MQTTTEITNSNNWRNTIKVKHLFTDGETTPELIVTICDTLIKQLKNVSAKEEKGNLCDAYREHAVNELNELAGHFEFLRDLANETTPEAEWGDYDFDGDYEKWFNDYLNQLYDLGDMRVVNTRNVREKFLFVD